METFLINSELECFDFALDRFLKESDPESDHTLFFLGKHQLFSLFCFVLLQLVQTSPSSLDLYTLRVAKMSSYLNARLLDIHLQ